MNLKKVSTLSNYSNKQVNLSLRNTRKENVLERKNIKCFEGVE